MNNSSPERKILPVLLSGGSGSRLWPMSRELYPKQLLNLCSDRSMIQDTAARVADSARFAPPLVVCNQEHRFVIAEQFRAIGCPPRAIVLEPFGRNTAAACAVAALMAAADDPDALLLVLPADHLIQDTGAFRRAVDRAALAAAAGRLVTFGITPTAPETGYGYIRRGGALTGPEGAGPEGAGLEGVFEVAAFVEKPNRAVAEGYLADGGYAWNSGMFLFPAAVLLAELERHAPAVLEAARAALAAGSADLDFFRLDPAAFGRAPDLAIDVAVMERTDRAAVVPCELGWTDVGVWSALWEVGARDAAGNVLLGDVVAEGASGCYVRSEHHLTALVGIEDAVVVVTDDAVLVAAKDRAQDVKKVVDRLKKAGRSEPVSHRKVHRPWGSYRSVHAGERFQVKELSVAPGARLSLQRHHHRAEHWVVVNGTALVTRGEEQVFVYENQSIYIPIGAVHRLENPGKVPLTIIEVQSGSYLGEDDIVRLDDSYGRG
ncbi:mannose-1-phosphate guanylyltransferase/mannose-6-phosphate isomerase [Azospirillum sp. RWY-5-1]|uniref:mannose-1-phosphate guanylyltransferase n=1 Tax=Azospirillum oleiclasticum TaxID=2735135 RepID=A0ABX2TLP6_9PROT|nr:mannose-1-phosphate guanylyltransferase/mannose-6-phosphate isomerase [Azospirillum oleiclasticum]NYZ17553.1 mannose-1-phosphate guanylyltransferase/mannose-6-phosphate isomerase [Azospirillum oleiclasticum]NYZ24655.1 mannose-1-phosphate guanylyltransferase/mannose-6-phosphate isomerase [Azospirillum oleiclasticum]